MFQWSPGAFSFHNKTQMVVESVFIAGLGIGRKGPPGTLSESMIASFLESQNGGGATWSFIDPGD
jgi:hypothetical protein